MSTPLLSIIIVICATLVGAMGPILLKKASSHKLSQFSSLIRNYPLMGGVAVYGISTVMFIFALRDGELSVLYPFVALNYIWVSLLSMKLLNERMNSLKWSGVALIIVGVSLIGFGS